MLLLPPCCLPLDPPWPVFLKRVPTPLAMPATVAALRELRQQATRTLGLLRKSTQPTAVARPPRVNRWHICGSAGRGLLVG